MAKPRRLRLKHGAVARGVSRVVLTLLSAVVLLPIVITFLYSFFTKSEIGEQLKLMGQHFEPDYWLPMLWAPKMASLRQYYTIFIEDQRYLQYFINSAMYTVAILLGQMVFIPMTSYALSRFKFRGREIIYFCVLMLMILPFQVTIVPNVLALRQMGLIDTIWAVIMPMWFAPFYIFLLRQFMIGIPNEIFEAGMMDGAGTFRTYVHVLLPVCRPIIGAAVALSFADSWNMVEQPLVYLSRRTDLHPLSVMFNNLRQNGGNDVAFAGAALYILPALLVYMYFQQDILLGVQLSELK